ncbi:MAG TPA: GTPase Era [Bryobacteraceae bacterium]|jgi:GTP-binding protein Era
MNPSSKRPRSRDTFHCGFVSILGLPNAGKSTLLNALLGTKIAIVAAKPQTTRTTIQGVVHMPKAQIVLLDTPGIHKSDSLINRRMMEQVRSAAQDRDLLLFVTDSTRVPHAKETQAIDLIKSTGTPAILVLNKVDKIEEKGELFERIAQFKEIHEFAEYVPISALKDDGIEELKKVIAKHLPLRQPMFPDDYLTDQPERFLASELVREKILRATHEEVPHAVAVVVEKWEDTPKLVRITATIYVERQGQKIIVIGKGGEMIKQIGAKARVDIEALLEKKVFLELFVKVKTDWREDAAFLSEIDWRRMSSE